MRLYAALTPKMLHEERLSGPFFIPDSEGELYGEELAIAEEDALYTAATASLLLLAADQQAPRLRCVAAVESSDVQPVALAQFTGEVSPKDVVTWKDVVSVHLDDFEAASLVEQVIESDFGEEITEELAQASLLWFDVSELDDLRAVFADS